MEVSKTSREGSNPSAPAIFFSLNNFSACVVFLEGCLNLGYNFGMKAIVIGASLSGKTTLIKYLVSKIYLPILEMDGELTRVNGGEFPMEEKLKQEVASKVINEIFNKESMLFFTNTDYFSDRDLIEAKEKGFKIVQLKVVLEELEKRNRNRVGNEGYQDMSQWLSEMVEYQNKIYERGLVDFEIDATQSVEKVSEDLLAVLDK